MEKVVFLLMALYPVILSLRFPGKCPQVPKSLNLSTLSSLFQDTGYPVYSVAFDTHFSYYFRNIAPINSHLYQLTIDEHRLILEDQENTPRPLVIVFSLGSMKNLMDNSSLTVTSQFHYNVETNYSIACYKPKTENIRIWLSEGVFVLWSCIEEHRYFDAAAMIGGTPQLINSNVEKFNGSSPRVITRVLNTGRKYLPHWFLQRMVKVNRSTKNDQIFCGGHYPDPWFLVLYYLVLLSVVVLVFVCH